jgi:hypothetical protein
VFIEPQFFQVDYAQIANGSVACLNRVGNCYWVFKGVSVALAIS